MFLSRSTTYRVSLKRSSAPTRRRAGAAPAVVLAPREFQYEARDGDAARGAGLNAGKGRTMGRILKYVLIILVLVIGGAVAAFYLTPSSTIARLAADETRAATGRELKVEGEIERRLFPTLGVTLGRVSLSNAEWAEAPELFTAEAIEVGVDVVSLLSGAIEVTSLRVERPRAYLETSDDGADSWDFVSADRGATEDGDGDGGRGRGGGGDVLVANAEIIDGALTYTDWSAGERLELTEIQATAALPALDKTLTIDASALIDGRRATLSGALDNPAKARAGEPVLTDLRFGAEGVSFTFTGDFKAPGDASPPEASGELAFTLDGDPATTDWLRAALGPEFEKLGDVDLKGSLNAKADTLALDLAGDADFNGLATEIGAKAQAGAGWMQGAEAADVDLFLRNDAGQIAYRGKAGLSPGGGPVLIGNAVVAAPSVGALYDWAGVSPPDASPLARLESVELSGDVDVGDAGAKARLIGAVGYNARQVSIDASLDGGPGWRDGAPVSTAVDIRSDGLLELSWNGSVEAMGDEDRVNGRAELAAPALRALADWAGAGPIEAPDGTFGTLDFAADIVVEPGRASVTAARLTLDATELAGDVRIDTRGDRPAVTAALDTGALDLRPFTGGGQGGGGAGGDGATGGDASVGASGGGRGWSDAPLELGVLKLVDVEFNLTTQGLITDVFRFGASQIDSTLKDGRLAIDIARMELYGGSAVGALVVDGRDTPMVDVDVEMSGVAIRPLLVDVAKLDSIEGTGAVALDIAGAGISVDAIMRSLAGDASVKLVDGAIIGYNLAALARNVASFGAASNETQKTDFAELSASFEVADGVARNEDLTMLGPLIRLTGAGSIDIGEQTLDYTLEPKAVASIEGQGGDAGARGLTFPLLVKGPWAKPKVRPDLAGGLRNIDQLLQNPDALGDMLQGLGGDARQDGDGGGQQIEPDKLLKGLFGD